LGIFLYAVSIAVLWLAAGRPAGSEAWCLKQVRWAGSRALAALGMGR
jgi:hypothetical protein